MQKYYREKETISKGREETQQEITASKMKVYEIKEMKVNHLSEIKIQRRAIRDEGESSEKVI